jgi:hypothetical protein
VKSLYDGSVSHVDQDVPFEVDGTIRFLPTVRLDQHHLARAVRPAARIRGLSRPARGR